MWKSFHYMPAPISVFGAGRGKRPDAAVTITKANEYNTIFADILIVCGFR
jgi:hypothetical protein